MNKRRKAKLRKRRNAARAAGRAKAEALLDRATKRAERWQKRLAGKRTAQATRVVRFFRRGASLRSDPMTAEHASGAAACLATIIRVS